MSDLLPELPSDTLRRVWLAGLAKLTKPDKAEVTAAGLVGMLPALAHLDDAAFNQDTLREVARKVKSGVPSFGLVEPVLLQWQQRNKPRVAMPQLPAPREARPMRMPWELAQEWDDAEGIARKAWDIGQRLDYADQAGGAFPPPPPGGPLPVVRDIEWHLALALTACVAKHAPRHMGMLRPEWIEAHERASRAG